MRFVMKFNYSLTWMMLAFLLAAAPRVDAQGQVIPLVEPAVLMVGDTGTYTLRFLNASQLPELEPPSVEGLLFSRTPSTGSFQQIINGRITSEQRLSWNFQAQRAGEFIIPSRSFDAGGRRVDIPAVRFTVVPMSEERKSRAVLDVQLPDPPYFVGQALPAQVNLLIRRDLELANAAFPQRAGDAFVNTEFSDSPARGTTQHNGQPYNVLQWNILVTPIRSGEAQLAFTQEIILQLPSPDRDFGSLFSFRTARTERTVLQSDQLTLAIRPLPTEGRPSSFEGAIGQFNLTAHVSTTELTAGEPLTLTLTLEGSGNFDRISPPALPEWDGWRVYPPKSLFEATDPNGFKGSKSFEYILIPQEEGAQEIPSVSYAFFNPGSAAYEEIELSPIAVEVAAASTPASSLVRSDPGTPAPAVRIPAELMPLRPVIGYTQPAGAAAWARPQFWIIQGLVLILAGSGAFWLRRLRLRDTDERLARRHLGTRRVRAALKRARQEVQSGGADSFLAHSRLALQESISRLSLRKVEAKTLVTSDCLRILEDANAHHDLRTSVRSILDTADAHAFARHQLDRASMEKLLAELEQTVAELNRMRN